jgi:hypothetical protein
MKVKRSLFVMVVLGLALCLAGAPAWGDDFYVIAGGGPSGKILKGQVFKSDTTNTTLGTGTWQKIDSPQWTYTKRSATSYLVITYQDGIMCKRDETLLPPYPAPFGIGVSFYQLRVNDNPSVAGAEAGKIFTQTVGTGMNFGAATAVWSGLPKGEVTLSIWHFQLDCTSCQTNLYGGTNVIVMEIES